MKLETNEDLRDIILDFNCNNQSDYVRKIKYFAIIYLSNIRL